MKKIRTMFYSYLIIITLISFFCCKANGQGVWTQRANIPGTGRNDLASFSIGQKGYFGCGNDSAGKMENDFWEWDQLTNTWSQKASLPGLPRRSVASFTIGTKGYVCVGVDSTTNFTNEVWEWDQGNDSWTQKSDFPGPCRGTTVGFSIGSKGYLGTGRGCGGDQKDFWEYDPTSDTWMQKADFGGLARYDAQGFSIGNKGYIGGGISNNVSPFFFADFWEYDPATDTWTQKTNLPEYRLNAAGFSIGNCGYFCAGVNDISQLNDLIEWDQSKNLWTHKASLPANVRQTPIGFSIGNKGYVGMGTSAQTLLNDFWEYTPVVIGINEIKDESAISVFPNPFSDYTNLHLAAPVYHATLSVHDILGKEIKRMENLSGKEITISRDGMSKGVYFYNIFDVNIISGQGMMIVE